MEALELAAVLLVKTEGVPCCPLCGEMLDFQFRRVDAMGYRKQAAVACPRCRIRSAFQSYAEFGLSPVELADQVLKPAIREYEIRLQRRKA